VAGAHHDDFLPDGAACLAAPVPPGGSCAIEVVFQPLEAGTRAAELLVDHNAPGSPATVSLTGEAPEPAHRLT
jgi:hypothetical protein